MNQPLNSNQLNLLMNEHSLSEINKEKIALKITNLLTFINELNTAKGKNIEATALENIYSNLLIEKKATARIIVNKNNSLSKNLIKNMATQKENLLQVIEISQLRLEAELKKLNSEISYPALKTDTSLFGKLFSIFKVPFRSSKTKSGRTVKNIRAEISSTTEKLNGLEKQKENLAKEFGFTGTEALKHLNKVTYNLFLPVSDTSYQNIENVKNKFTLLKK